MTKIIYDTPRKARVIDASGVSETIFEYGDIVDICAEFTDTDGEKFYYLSAEDCMAHDGWLYKRFKLLEEESPPEIVKETPKELTPCETLGYKVGDMFVMTFCYNEEGFKLGDEVMLIEDDATQVPKFFSKSANDYTYITLNSVQKMINTKAFSIKEFLESMPKSADAFAVIEVGKTTINAYGSEFECTTEERLQEVMAALIVLYKEEV